MLHPDVEALLEAMRALERFLAQNSESQWSAKISQAADRVEASDVLGLAQFLEMFGGMGSLNDIIIIQDRKLPRAENEELDALRASAWTQAHNLRHEIH